MCRSSLLAVAVAVVLAGTALADDAAEARAILDKAVQAQGGADKTIRLGDVTFKAKTTISEGGNDIAVAFDASTAGFDRIRMDLTITVAGMANGLGLVLNVDKGWIRNAQDNKVEDAPKEVVAFMRQFLFALRAAAHPSGLAGQKAVTLAPGGVAKVGDRDSNILRISRKDHADIVVYFDAKTGLPLKSETRMKEPDGAEEKEFAFQFSDFKETDGVKHFGRVKLLRDGKELADVELTDFKVGEKFDANTFEKP